MKPWVYEGQAITEPAANCVGFVYEIRHTVTDQYYIGKKVWYNTLRLPALKGTKRKRTVVKESNWQEYWSSSSVLQAMVENQGSELWKRTILRTCENKSEMSYWEAKLQFEKDVLRDPLSLNGFIGCRINRKGIK